jgi:hypothetical protein
LVSLLTALSSLWATTTCLSTWRADCSSNELIESVKTWLRTQASDFFDTGIQKLNPWYNICLCSIVIKLRSSLRMHVFFVHNIFSLIFCCVQALFCFKVGECILLRMYLISKYRQPSFATVLQRALFYTYITTCFG